MGACLCARGVAGVAAAVAGLVLGVLGTRTGRAATEGERSRAPTAGLGMTGGGGERFAEMGATTAGTVVEVVVAARLVLVVVADVVLVVASSIFARTLGATGGGRRRDWERRPWKEMVALRTRGSSASSIGGCM